MFSPVLASRPPQFGAVAGTLPRQKIITSPSLIGTEIQLKFIIPTGEYRLVAHLDILLEELYRHLECLLKKRKSASSCCRVRWIS